MICVANGVGVVLKALEVGEFWHEKPRQRRQIKKLLSFAANRGYVVPREYQLSEYELGYIEGYDSAMKTAIRMSRDEMVDHRLGVRLNEFNKAKKV